MELFHLPFINNVLDTFSMISRVSIEIPMTHVLLYSIFLLLFFILGSHRGIAITSFIFAINLGVMQNMGFLSEVLHRNPVMWLPYVLVGSLFLVIICYGLIQSS